MNPVVKVLNQASELSNSELDALLEKLKALRGVSTKVKQKESDVAEDTYRCIVEAVQKLRNIGIMPLHVFKSKAGWAEFAEAAEEADKFISSLETDRVKKLALRKWLCRMIVTYLSNGDSKYKYAFTWGLFNLQNIVDSEFPGYIESGLMPLVLKRLYAGTKKKLVLSP